MYNKNVNMLTKKNQNTLNNLRFLLQKNTGYQAEFIKKVDARSLDDVNETGEPFSNNFQDNETLPKSLLFMDQQNEQTKNMVEAELSFQTELGALIPLQTVLEGDVNSSLLDENQYNMYQNVNRDVYAFKKIINDNGIDNFNSMVNNKNITEAMMRLRNTQAYQNTNNSTSVNAVNPNVNNLLSVYANQLKPNVNIDNKVSYIIHNQFDFLNVYEAVKKLWLENALIKVPNINNLKQLRFFIESVCLFPSTRQVGRVSFTLKVFVMKNAPAQLNYARICMLYDNKIVDLNETIQDVVNNVTNDNFAEIKSDNIYQSQADNFFNLLTTSLKYHQNYVLADQQQIQHLTFAKYWNYIINAQIKFRNTNKLAPNLINDFANTTNFGEFRTEAYLSNRMDLIDSHREEIVIAIIKYTQKNLVPLFIQFGEMFIGNDDEMYNYFDLHINSFPNIADELSSMRNDYSKTFLDNPYVISVALAKYILKTFFYDGILPLVTDSMTLSIRNDFMYHVKSDEQVSKFVDDILKFCDMAILHVASLQQNIELFLVIKFLYTNSMKNFPSVVTEYQKLFNSISTVIDVDIFMKNFLNGTTFPNGHKIMKGNKISSRKRQIDFMSTFKEEEILPTEKKKFPIEEEAIIPQVEGNQNQNSIEILNDTADNIKGNKENKEFNTSVIRTSTPKKSNIRISSPKKYYLRSKNE